MGLNDSDNDVIAVFCPRGCALEYLVGLADPGRCADKDPEFADTSLLSPCSFKQGIRRGSLLRFAQLIRHQRSTS
jgi:hypothetical protein